MEVSERELLTETAIKVDKLYGALMDADPITGKSFVKRTADVVDAAEKGSWAVKWAVRITLGLGAIVGAFGAIWTFVK